jgi:hypothetical protein
LSNASQGWIGAVAGALIVLAGALVAYMWKQWRKRRREWDRNIELEMPSNLELYRDDERESDRESEIDLTAIDNEENV